MSQKRINVALVGLSFGAEFIPIYQKHPHANLYAICQRDPKKLQELGDAFGVEKRFTSYEDLLKDPNVDAVHINTPVNLHAAQTIAALNAGKHVGCTIPSGTTVADCWEIVKAAERSKKNYMLMETVIYSREFLHARELRDSGKFGRIQFLRGSHLQNMEGWPEYWKPIPPRP